MAQGTTYDFPIRNRTSNIIILKQEIDGFEPGGKRMLGTYGRGPMARPSDGPHRIASVAPTRLVIQLRLIFAHTEQHRTKNVTIVP